MRSITLKAVLVAAAVCSAGLYAQAATNDRGLLAPGATFQNEPPPGGFLPDPPSEQGVCPPSGYAPPVYGLSGDNDGITQPYEVASPCNSQEVRDVSEAIGMGRTRPITVKVITTIRFGITGMLAPPLGMGANTKGFVEMNFFRDSVRLDLIGTDGKHVGHVVDDGVAWDETDPGMGYSPAPKTAAAERSPLMKLTPFGAWLSIVEAEGHATMTKGANGAKTFTGTSPYDNIPVTVTVNAKNIPTQATAKANGHTYTATFSDYSEGWEPGYFYIFPTHMVWTMDGKPLANLTTTEFKSNPYVVFPRPAPLRSAAN